FCRGRQKPSWAILFAEECEMRMIRGWWWGLVALAGLMQGARVEASHCGACCYPAASCYEEQCCVPSVRYRVSYQTVVDERTPTCYRPGHQTVMHECRYTVCRPVYEQHVRECHYTVCKPVWENYNAVRHYTVCRTVTEHGVRECPYTICRQVVQTYQ